MTPTRLPLTPTSILRVGILTISDRASHGVYEDRGGPAIRDYMTDLLACRWEALAKLVADEIHDIAAAMRELAEVEGCALVLATGGTGPAPRDVTPEALESVAHKMMPGFGEAMRATSLKTVPTAILSRQTAGIRGQSLIITLPGNPKAIAECLDAVMPAVPYCIDLLGGPYVWFKPDGLVAFRPKHAVVPPGVVVG